MKSKYYLLFWKFRGQSWTPDYDVDDDGNQVVRLHYDRKHAEKRAKTDKDQFSDIRHKIIKVEVPE